MKKLPLRDGGYAWVDDEDFKRLSKYTWHEDWRSGYIVRHTTLQNPRRSVTLYLHREVMNAPKGVQVDHRFGDIRDCRKQHLRFSNQSQNRANSRKMSGCRSAYKGVRRHKKGNWYCRMWIPRLKREVWIDSSPSEHLMALMHDFWAKEIWGDFAKTNFKVVKWG